MGLLILNIQHECECKIKICRVLLSYQYTFINISHLWNSYSQSSLYTIFIFLFLDTHCFKINDKNKMNEKSRKILHIS